MKYALIGGGLLVLIVLAVLFHPWHNAERASGLKEYYTCPMHPSVISDHPGACPVCGMALVKKSAPPSEVAHSTEEGHVHISASERIAANVSTVRAARRMVSSRVAATGAVAFAEPLQAIVPARFRGRIERLFARSTGTVVRSGDPLFSVYSPDLITAEREYLLSKSSDAGSGDLLSASASRLKDHYGLTEAQISELAASGHTHSTITYYSPISGTVIEKNLQEGQYVDEGTALYRLADLRRVWVIAEVYEKDLRYVKVGQAAEVRADAFPSDTFAGRVSFVEPVLNGETRTARVRVELDNRQGKLKINMYAALEIEGASHQGLVVPRSAVLFTGGRPLVWVEGSPGHFQKRGVELGVTSESSVEVVSGLEEGEMVASSGGFLIDSESQLAEAGGSEHHHQ